MNRSTIYFGLAVVGFIVVLLAVWSFVRKGISFQNYQEGHQFMYHMHPSDLMKTYMKYPYPSFSLQSKGKEGMREEFSPSSVLESSVRFDGKRTGKEGCKCGDPMPTDHHHHHLHPDFIDTLYSHPEYGLNRGYDNYMSTCCDKFHS